MSQPWRLGCSWLALAVRLPAVMLIPPATSEGREVMYSLQIIQGKLLLAINVEPYLGSLFNYIVAGVFYLFGPSVEHARLILVVFGALTVPLSYFFATVIEDRFTGVLTALMIEPNGNVQSSFDYLLTLDAIPHRTPDLTLDTTRADLSRPSPNAIALVLSPESFEAVSPKMRLRQLTPHEYADLLEDNYGVVYTEPSLP